jgi:hypothetical protein
MPALGVAALLACHARSVTDGPVFVFVGERRSARALALGATWEDGRLAARTLHEALRAAGHDPLQALYVNLFADGAPGWEPLPEVLARLRSLALSGVVVVGLGRRVQAALSRAGVPHRALTHPAARGRIRSRARYRAHVAEVLGSTADARA